jgi:H2-forming N5,N10-methylenetetrahydromethanopterin dehydrogenase-like enzyme
MFSCLIMTKTREELLAEGWEQRFVADEPRLSEAVELYESMGYEVYLLPLDKDTASECDICFEGYQSRYRIIYTKRRG